MKKQLITLIPALFFVLFLIVSCRKDEFNINTSNSISVTGKISGKLKIVESNTNGAKYLLKGDLTNEADEISVYTG